MKLSEPHRESEDAGVPVSDEAAPWVSECEEEKRREDVGSSDVDEHQHLNS